MAVTFERNRRMATEGVRFGAVRGSSAPTAPASSPWVERLLEHFTTVASAPGGREQLVEQEGAVLAALRCAGEAGCWEKAIELIRHAEPAFATTARWGAWKVVLELAVTAGRELGDPALEGWALHELGVRSLALGDEGEARRLLSDALASRRQASDADGAALTESQLELLAAPS